MPPDLSKSGTIEEGSVVVHRISKTISLGGLVLEKEHNIHGWSLNIDMSSTVFIELLPVIDFVKQLLKRDDSTRPLSDIDCLMIKKALKGIRIEVTHRGVNCMKYNISGLTSQATQDLKFPLGDTYDMVYLVDYFRDTYKFSIQHMQWPCLEVGYSKKVKGQRCSKRLNDRHITALLKVTCQRPQDREQGIPAHLVCA